MPICREHIADAENICFRINVLDDGLSLNNEWALPILPREFLRIYLGFQLSLLQVKNFDQD